MKFKKIGLVMAYETEKIIKAYDNLSEFLKQNSVEHLVCRSLSQLVECAKQLDVAIVVGGDGSMLAAATIASAVKLPLIGVHYGKLGFLTDIDPSALPELMQILSGHYIKEDRAMLEISVNDDNSTHLALNEVAINRKDDSHLIAYDLYVAANIMCAQSSDGVLIHTPTGSTAYAMSAGGPIIQPLVNTIGIVPLNPHRLNTRPIMIRNDQIITVKLSEQTSVAVSCDGKRLQYDAVNKVTIKPAPAKLTLIHPESYDYFARLRHKLKWEL